MNTYKHCIIGHVVHGPTLHDAAVILALTAIASLRPNNRKGQG